MNTLEGQDTEVSKTVASQTHSFQDSIGPTLDEITCPNCETSFITEPIPSPVPEYITAGGGGEEDRDSGTGSVDNIPTTSSAVLVIVL